jgi:hypothetical protein
MLGLQLRDEFLGVHMPGTAIALRNSDDTGAAQQDAEKILTITYPTADVQTALKQLSSKRAQRPIVLMGDRGSGKSHIMAVMHHAVESPDIVQRWAREWGGKSDGPLLSELELLQGFKAISEPVQNHEYPLLWNLLFERHSKGEFFKGKFQQIGQPYPPKTLLIEMFEAQPTVLILDEFQKWFDGLRDDPGPEGTKWRTWASNFVQNLSEISAERPDILIPVISVLDNQTEAFRQVHRNSPVLVDFRGPTAKQDRQKMVLHRLFTNRGNIPQDDIQGHIASYAQERYRLRFSHLPETEKANIMSEVAQSWPFTPELMELLEEHILMAEAAQEARDLIRILAHAYRARGEDVPVITPADFFVDEDAGGVQSLLDSIATAGTQERLREIAQNNLELIRGSGVNIPHARELVSALWMRSMSPGRTHGGTRQDLHIDITRDAPVDDNAFNGEIASLLENSKNIHGEETTQGLLRFELAENPRSLVRATARNDRLWQDETAETVAGQITYPAADVQHIRATLRHILSPEATEPSSRIIVLGPRWQDDPWSEVEEPDKPSNWDRPAAIVIPESFARISSGKIPILGTWLAEKVKVKRNTIRFLLSSKNKNMFDDGELRFLARCSYLTTCAWKDDPRFRALKSDFDAPFRKNLESRLDRFAVLQRWDYQQPEKCEFEVERIDAKGPQIVQFVETKLFSDIFDLAEFGDLILRKAQKMATVGEIIDELSEPPATPDKEAIVFLGAVQIYEQILKIAAMGKIVLNVDGNWITRSPEHEDDEQAWKAIRGRAFRTGQEMRQVQLALPGAAGGTTVTVPTPTGAQQPPPQGGQTTVTGGLFGGSGPGGAVVTPPVGGGGPSPKGGVVSPPIQTKTHRTEQAANGINLCGYFERWGIEPSQVLDTARIELNNVTPQQMKQILQRLPSSLKASLEVAFREGAE